MIFDILQKKLWTPELEKLRKESEEVQQLLNDFNSYNGWILTRDADGIKTFYKHEDPNPIHSIRLEGMIDCPLLNILSVVYEVDLYTGWWPLVT